MLIALFIAILTGGGSDALFLVTDLDKKIKKEVQNKDTQKEIMALYKTASKEVKTFRKSNDKVIKALKKAQKNDLTQKAELQGLFYESLEKRSIHEATLIDASIAVRGKLSDSEFENIIQEASNPNAKTEKKANKSTGKQNAAVTSLLLNIQSSIDNEIKNESNRTELLKEFEGFEENMVLLLQDLQTFNYEDEKMFQERKVSKPELEEIYGNLNTTRKTFFDEFINLHFKIKELSTEEEWKAISKKLNKIF